MAARAGSTAPRRSGGCDGGPGGAGSNLHAGNGGGRAHDAGSSGQGHRREEGEETGTSELEAWFRFSHFPCSPCLLVGIALAEERADNVLNVIKRQAIENQVTLY